MNLAERRQKFQSIDLYPVITPEFCAGRSPVKVLAEVLQAGVKIVQLRDKTEPEKYAAAFRELTSEAGALLIINDSVELALKYQADGVHLGQHDLPVKQARALAQEILLGVSAHNLEEALAAQQAGADYVNIGPIFKTQTKAVSPIGLDSLKLIVPQLKIPFTVMGGITLNNIDQVVQAGAERVAVITAVTQAKDAALAAKQLIGSLRQ